MQKLQEIWVRSLGWEDPLVEGMATPHLQYSCLESPMDRGFWQVTIHGIAGLLKQLSTHAHRGGGWVGGAGFKQYL